MSTHHKILKRLYMIYGMSVFGLIFALLFIPFLIPIIFPKRFRWVGILNRWWSKALFFMITMPWKREYRAPLDSKGTYIFCANHFSWLDIPTMGLIKNNMVFVGKNEIEAVPLFGWMYGKLHTSIDRKALNSLQSMLTKAAKALDQGKSLCIFPEGGIRTKNPPQMALLKAGAFRMAIEKKIPIVPVTIPNNWMILSNQPMLLTWGKVKIIFHEPIDVTGMTKNDIGALKENVYNTIDAELKKQHAPW